MAAAERGLVHEVPLADLVDHIVSGDLSDAGVAARVLVTLARATTVPEAMTALQHRIRGLLIGR